MVSGRKVLVPVTDSPASLSALRAACAYAAREQGTVEAVYVIEVPRTLPLDVNLDAEAQLGELVLRRAQETGEPYGCKVTGELLQARVAASAILEEALSREVDMIVVGVHAQQRDGKFALGSTVMSLLRQAPCDVWLIRKTGEE